MVMIQLRVCRQSQAAARQQLMLIIQTLVCLTRLRSPAAHRWHAATIRSDACNPLPRRRLRLVRSPVTPTNTKSEPTHAREPGRRQLLALVPRTFISSEEPDDVKPTPA